MINFLLYKKIKMSNSNGNNNFIAFDKAIDELSVQYQHEENAMLEFYVDGHLPETLRYQDNVKFEIDNLIYDGKEANRAVNSKKASEVMTYIDQKYNETASKDTSVIGYIEGSNNHGRFYHEAKALVYAARYLENRLREKDNWQSKD